MKELETLERAKNYMEKLANGINPLDGTLIPDEEVVNNVRLSRCFFYVADVLRRVIDYGGIPSQGNVTKESKPAKNDFVLPVEKRKLFEFSEKPIPISDISKRINNLIDKETMKSLSYSAIREWLISIEVLASVPVGEGRFQTRPTQNGNELGVSVEYRNGQNGLYGVVVYNIDAQRFILDNLDAIIERELMDKANRGKPWSEEHDACLADLFQKGVPVDEIAITLKRNSGAVRKRLRKLGLIN